ncbi:hypothetical protein L931_07560 [Helicobacter pylori PZ5024]|uniref:Uncharacterized protein n=1 Tax=Helicobacter pylori PZ5024 TaxID=1337391 RepID=T2T452_HELPX|nr:hypothetical protein L930_05220 [Helicobacter pylori PZ5004]EQD99428.1 hypothetical protein L931_07560 [Helicobacter pylori PZ5024]
MSLVRSSLSLVRFSFSVANPVILLFNSVFSLVRFSLSFDSSAFSFFKAY